MLKKIIIIFASLLVASFAYALENYSGEKIIYAISPMGVAEYNDLGQTLLDGESVSLVTFRTQVAGFDDTEKIYSDPRTDLPIRVERDIQMWFGHENIIEKYDRKNFNLSITKFKGEEKVEELSFSSTGPIHNAVLLPFSLRRQSNLVIGWKTEIRLPKKFIVELIDIQDIQVPAGKFSALHFVSNPPQFEIWISNDALRLPLKIKDTGGFGYTLLIKERDKKQ